MSRRVFILATIVWAVSLLGACASAQNSVAPDETSSGWLAVKERFGNLGNAGRCDEQWDVLWPWAKKGKGEARALLLFIMVPPPDMPHVFAPGNTGDFVSRMRDAEIMAIHSYDYKPNEKVHEAYEDVVYQLGVNAGFADSIEGREFLACVKSKSKSCADIAVKGKLVPSFEDYARQVDALINQGFESTCIKAKD